MSKKFASASTAIGLARIVRAETKLMNICWVVMALISLVFGLHLTYGTIREYLEYDVFTKTELISSSSIILPSVSFCFTEPNTTDLNSLFQKAEFYFYNDSLTDITNITGEQLYSESLMSFDTNCCIKFNHFRNKSDTQFISAYSSDDEFLFEIDLSIKFERVRVFLSDNYDNIIDWSHYAALSSNVNGFYSIALRKKVEYKLEKPYNRCKNVSDITYRQANCVVQCKNKNFARKHNCTLGNYYYNPSYSFCAEEISRSLEFDLVCKEQCPKECTTLDFEILVNNPVLAFNSSNKLVFKIWYLDFNYIEISQTPKMSGYSLLNEIGGALGLFVGISFLSILELFEYLFEIFLIYYN